jgi:predicted nucleic acid-binding protein
MRVLLDTNVLIHREATTVVRQDIGKVFFWLDKLKHEKCVHPVSLAEIAKHRDERVRATFQAKLQSYQVLKTTAPMSAGAQQFSATDLSENDKNDTLIVNEVLANRVEILITEDRGVHTKAALLDIADRVFTLDSFLEKVTAENPDLVDYKVLAVKRAVFGAIDVSSEFFDSFRQDYGGVAFDKWFARKSDETAYVCYEGTTLVAFLYLKPEGQDENYGDIEPGFTRKNRLKIGTFKVEMNGYKLGERFLKIIFDNALRQNVNEVYVTIFQRTLGQQRLMKILEDFGFTLHGTKTGTCGNESVYVRSMAKAFDAEHPTITFPFISVSARAFLTPIYPEYHTSLLPDSILRTESPANFVEQEPHRNAIRKVYISRSIFRDLRSGDAIVFYRTGGYYKSVVTTVGVVEDVHRNIRDESHFISLCRKRSVFTDKELTEQWRYKSGSRPFIVGFLYSHSFPRRPTMKELIDNGVIRDPNSAPRGFEPITKDQFKTILRLATADPRSFVHYAALRRSDISRG